MSSPDFRIFVDSLMSGHIAWFNGPHSANTLGDDFFIHYVGDATRPGALLWQYENWRNEYGYSRVRPWNGSETLGRFATPDVPFPGLVVPFASNAVSAGPTIDPRLADGRSKAQLQSDFPTTNDL